MKLLLEKLKFAFAVKPSPDKSGLSEEEMQLLSRIARELQARGLEAPAIMALESVRPLSFLGAQGMVALRPIVGAFFSTLDYDRLARVLERRDGMERLIRMLEEPDAGSGASS